MPSDKDGFRSLLPSRAEAEIGVSAAVGVRALPRWVRVSFLPRRFTQPLLLFHHLSRPLLHVVLCRATSINQVHVCVYAMSRHSTHPLS